MLHWFAGKHIRNTAVSFSVSASRIIYDRVFQTWAGNLMTASPISDLNPLFMAANGSKILVESASSGKRYIDIDDKFFTAYRKTVVKPEEFVVQMEVPFTGQVSH